MSKHRKQSILIIFLNYKSQRGSFWKQKSKITIVSNTFVCVDVHVCWMHVSGCYFRYTRKKSIHVMGSVTQNKRRKRETKTFEIKWDHEIEESKISILMKHSQSIRAAFKKKEIILISDIYFRLFVFTHPQAGFFPQHSDYMARHFFLSFHRFDIVCVMRWSFICSANRKP